MLSSEWAVLPEFLPIAVNDSHFGMTKLSSKDQAFEAISTVLESWVNELTTATRTTRAEPTYTDRPTQPERVTESIKPGAADSDEALADKIFDNMPRDSLPEAKSHSPSKMADGGFG